MIFSTAFAAGFTIGDPGACATARPCVAGASGIEDSWINPASISDTREMAVGVTLGGSNAFGSFAGDGQARMAIAPTPLPRAIFGVRKDHWAFALAVGPPVDGARQVWPSRGIQRYSLEERSLAVLDVGPVVSARFGPLAVGVGGELSTLTLDQTLAATTSPGTDPAYDVHTRVQGAGLGGVARLGVRLTWPAIQVGASFRSGARYRARGPLTVDFSENTYFTGDSEVGQLILDPVTTDAAATTPLVLPPSARVGVELHAGEVRLELDGGWEGWHIVEDLTVEDVNLDIATTGGEPIVVDDDLRVPMGLRDSFSASLGAEWRHGRNRYRLGVRYESGAADDLIRSALINDPNKIGGGLGVAVDSPGPWAIDVTLGGDLGIANDVSRSIAAQLAIDPLSGRVGFGDLVGRGELHSASLRLVIGLRWEKADLEETR